MPAHSALLREFIVARLGRDERLCEFRKLGAASTEGVFYVLLRSSTKTGCNQNSVGYGGLLGSARHIDAADG